MKGKKIIIQGGKLWDGRNANDRLLKQPVIFIENGIIIHVGSLDEPPPQELTARFSSAITYRYPKGIIIPGLIDTHLHLMFGTKFTTYENVMINDSDELMLLRAVENAKSHLTGGVTVIRDLGSRGDTFFELRKVLSKGILAPTPDLLVSGPAITITGGHFWFCGGEADGAGEIRKSVRTLIKKGADTIKFMATGGLTAGTDPGRASFTEQELKIGVEEAHRHGVRVAAHCKAIEGIRNAVNAGVDSLEHCSFLDSKGRIKFDPLLAEEIANKELYVDPTLQAIYWHIQNYEKILNERKLTCKEQELFDYSRYHFEQVSTITKKMFEMGVKIIGGSDALRTFGNYYLTYELLCQAGITASAALKAVTSLAAESLGLKHVGVVAQGKAADLIVLDADSLASPQALRNIRQVFKSGVPIK